MPEEQTPKQNFNRSVRIAYNLAINPKSDSQLKEAMYRSTMRHAEKMYYAERKGLHSDEDRESVEFALKACEGLEEMVDAKSGQEVLEKMAEFEKWLADYSKKSSHHLMDGIKRYFSSSRK